MSVVESIYLELDEYEREFACKLVGHLAKDGVKIPDALWASMYNDMPHVMVKYRIFKRMPS